jgi:predicted dehydrogenase
MFRAAIIGTGRIGSQLEKDPLRPKPHSHAGWYRHHPRTTLVAGADRDADRLAEFGVDWELPDAALFTDYHVMLDTVHPDIVSVCAWAPDRVDMAIAAIQAGARGLWLEKAVACTMGEAIRLEQAVAAAGVATIVDHPRRGVSEFRAVKQIIDDGRLGALHTVHCLMSGCLMHTGTHAWDMLDYWCGPWRRAQAWLEAPVPASGPIEDGGGHARIVFDHGVQAFVSAHHKDYFIFQFDLIFSQGRVQIGNDLCRVYERAPSTRYTGFVELAAAPFPAAASHPYPMVGDLVHTMDTGDEPAMSLRNATAAFRMGLALFQSNRDAHRVITPDDLDPQIRIVSR